MDPRLALLAEVETFLERTGVSPSRFGTEALGDPTFVSELRGGREPKHATGQRVRKWMRDNGQPGSRA